MLPRGPLLHLLACLAGVAAWAEPLADGDAAAMATAAALQDDDACTPGTTESCSTELLQLRASRSSAEEALSETEDVASQQRSAGEDAALDAVSGEQGDSTSRNIKTLYHQTSPGAGQSILRTGFRLGTHHAICGSAIYFSPSVKDTDPKAIGGRGYIIQAKVDLGRMRWMTRNCDYHMTGARLKREGFQSITLDRGGFAECKHMASCREYVVYSPRQVLSTKGFYYHGWKHWYSKYTGSSDLPPADSSAESAGPDDDDSMTVEQLVVAGVLTPDAEFEAGGAGKVPEEPKVLASA